MEQPIFGSASFDSLQYHVFCEDTFFSVRLQRTPSVEHSSVWLYDGSTRELINSTDRIIQTNADYLDIDSPGLSISVPNDGNITARDPRGQTVLEIELKPDTEIVWGFPSGDPNRPDQPVIHQPDIQCKVTYRGQESRGMGYCKRAYLEPPRYMGYVFIHGVSTDRTRKLWTADASWGESKYDYFKLINPNGDMEEADSTDSYHQWDAAYAYIGGRRIGVHLEDIGKWQTSIISGRMDSLYGQRYCRLKVEDGDNSFEGQALKEYWLGTIG